MLPPVSSASRRSRSAAHERVRAAATAWGSIRTARTIRSFCKGFAVVVLACLLAACRAEEPPRAGLVPALGGVAFAQPVELGALPDGRIFVVEREGQVWFASEDGKRSLIADLASRVEARRGEGVLSMALDPSFEESGWVWIYYFAADEPWRSVLARFEVVDDQINLGSELVVLEMEQPGFNQNGGAIRFDGQGYLYLSVGDGSASTDPFEQGQDPSTLLATVLRLDVSASSSAEPYRVPPSNPFVGQAGFRPEIFAYGFRNPWRMSIDGPSGEIWLGDVGFSNAEEIDLLEAGGNYGWSVFEGTHCLARDCDAAPETFVPPVYEYPHTEGRCAVVGGLIYRGEAIAGLGGHYLFGDLCSGEIWALPQRRSDIEVVPVLLAELDGMPVTFGFDADGEVLIADYQWGVIYRLVQEDAGG